MSVSSSGLLRYAASFLNTSNSALREYTQSEDLERLPPLLYLLGHAIELALKAHLFACGTSERRLKGKLGHNLYALLEASRQAGLDQFVALTAEQEAAIQLLSPYYSGKELEYFSPGYKRMPIPGPLSDTAQQLVAGLHAFCMEKTLAQRAAEKQGPDEQERDRMLSRWREYLVRIHNDIVPLHANRYFWRELVRIVQANQAIPEPGHVMAWFAKLYSTTQAMGIRRHADRDERSITLARLLTEIRDHPSVMSRGQYLQMYDGADELLRRRGDPEYDRFSGPGRDSIDPEIVDRDLEELTRITKTIRRYATKQIAHLDAKQLKDLPTYNDLDSALDEFERLLKRYTLLLTCKGLTSAQPTPQFNWTGAFTVAWIPPRPDRAHTQAAAS